MGTVRLLVMVALALPHGLLVASATGDLRALREVELQQLSVCPSRPSVAIVGDDTANVFLTTSGAAAGGTLDFVERQRLAALTTEACLGPDFDPASVTPAGNLVFAMYLVEVLTSLGTTPPTVTVTTGSGACAAAGGPVARTTNYFHREMTPAAFGTQAIRPVCGDGHLVPVALIRVPNLGVPGTVDITPNCSARSGRARFSFRRQF